MGNKENITCQVLQRYNVTRDVVTFARLAASPECVVLQKGKSYARPV